MPSFRRLPLTFLFCHTLYCSAWMGFQVLHGNTPRIYETSDDIVASHRVLIAALATRPLRHFTFFRSQPLMERREGVDHEKSPLLPTNAAYDIFEDVARVWRLEHPWAPPINLLGFSRSDACPDALKLGPYDSLAVKGGFCQSPWLTFDGHHPDAWQSGPRFQATLDAVVDHACHQGSPVCDLLRCG